MADIFSGSKFSEGEMGVSASPRVTSSRNVPKGGGRYQIGKPYQVAGRWFEPREQPELDITGQASWYGPAFHGRLTANGEVFDQYHLSAAHPTLPLPSYVRVTNLANGVSTIVRVNDRGPFAHNRVIDLSRRTAEVLGFIDNGIADVRVQYVGPAPLEGDDTRFLVASINQITPLEDPAVQVAYQETQVAQAETGTALDAISGAATPVPSDIPFQVLGYSALVEDTGLSAMPEPTGTPVQIALGNFDDPARADAIARAFALYGAVDRTEVVLGDAVTEGLALSYLREGVTIEDVTGLAAELGLNTPVLY
ncbi:septal ring lytic transglycosylase RlpA family protein [Pelagibacterium sp. HS1C4-1]|nr:septal ring lytic transglycosylase RlpA family protein [Pelagibacterium xiamenense]MCD7061013.1 septal ring lytic transglycosylase RlpA family protein [Pelagibacterium xiamenense]